MPELLLKELKNRRQDLRARDFFKNMRPKELPLKLQGLKLLFRKLLLKPWRDKWLLP